MFEAIFSLVRSPIFVCTDKAFPHLPYLELIYLLFNKQIKSLRLLIIRKFYYFLTAIIVLIKFGIMILMAIYILSAICKVYYFRDCHLQMVLVTD